MILERYENDLQKLIDEAAEMGNKINTSTIVSAIDVESRELQDILDYFHANGIETINSDVELDYMGCDEGIVNPFDPSKISIKMDKLTMDLLIKRIRNNEFEFESDFQRKPGLWNDIQKSQLIESILLRIPLQAFYFDTTDDNKWVIIDGLQRITTIKQFVVDKDLKLRGMEFFKELNGKKFDELPRSLQRRIEETNINAYLVDPSTPSNAKFSIFKRINTGGSVLTPQEIRNALYQGAATRFLKELAGLPEFVEATMRDVSIFFLMMKRKNAILDILEGTLKLGIINSCSNLYGKHGSGVK